MSFIKELKRRNVIRVAIAYAVAAWLLIEISTTTFPMLRLPEWTATFVTVLLMIGFPVALIFAWAFELTPEGIKKEKDVDRTESITHVTGRKLDFAIIAVLAIAVVYFVADKFFSADDLATESQLNVSIAVLPFTPMSSGEDDEYFADGLTEEILNALAGLPELQVTARTSSFYFKGENIPVPDIAARLNVAHVVEGSVRRDDERVRITAQLIRASDGFHLWSQSYDRTLDDIFAVQEDIAENIAEALNVVLDDDARKVMRSAGIRDVEAFIAYQKGVAAFETAHEQTSLISESLAIANTYFDRALETVPELAIARVWKADHASHAIIEIAAGLRDEEYPGEAKELLAALQEEYGQALRLSPPGNQRDILHVERALMSEDWSGLSARIQKAMLPGRCPQMNWSGEAIIPLGWAEQVAEKHRETLACDPMAFFSNIHVATSLVWLGDPEAALQALEETENRGISNALVGDVRFWALLAAGHVNHPDVRGPDPGGSEMRLYPRQILWEALEGDPAVARQIADGYWSRLDADNFSSLVVAAVVGDRERANEFAARIDAYPGSAVLLSGAVVTCFCGAPFDLEATPNYQARVEEAGFPWPPPKRIDYPTKTW